MKTFLRFMIGMAMVGLSAQAWGPLAQLRVAMCSGRPLRRVRNSEFIVFGLRSSDSDRLPDCLGRAAGDVQPSPTRNRLSAANDYHVSAHL